MEKDGLQKVIDGHNEIQESVSLVRRDRFNNEIQVVYLVPRKLTLANATRFTLGEFSAGLVSARESPVVAQDKLDIPLNRPVRMVLVNAIPRDQCGLVDEARLKAMPVLDVGLMANWSKALQSIEGIDKAVVVNVLKQHKLEYLHQADIFGSIGTRPGSADYAADKNSSKTEEINEASLTKVGTALAEAHGQGQPLDNRLDDRYSLSLANLLYRAIDTSPDKGIQYVDQAGNRSFQTYPQLLASAQSVLAGLQARGVGAGDKVLLQCADNGQFLAVFWACVLGGIIPVPMSVAPFYAQDNSVVQKLLNVWQVFEHPVIVVSDNLTGDFERLVQASDLSAGNVLFFGQLTASASAAEAGIENAAIPDALALLLLTSGSTGTPKAVMHTHQTLVNRCASTSSFNHFNRDDVSLNWMPLDHVGGIVMFHLRDVYNACSQVHVATSWILEQPLRWLDTIDSERASITWAPNFAYALVNDQAEEISQRTWDLSCMRFILNAGEAVVARTASQFLRLLARHNLPEDSMKPAWGMSETASAVSFSHKFTAATKSDADGAVEVGGPIPNTSLRIVDAANRLLHEGEKGNLQIKGASITPGYYLNPEANQKAFSDDDWFDTGDAGVLKNGRLTITARVKDEIIINGVNHPAAEIETVTESVPGVEISFTAACAVRREGSDTDALAIFFCPMDDSLESLARLTKKIQGIVASNAGVKPEILIALSPSQVPKTNIGKIQRSLLRQKFEQGEFDEKLKLTERLLGTNVIPDWFYTKNWYPKSIAASRVPGNDRQFLVFCDNTGFGASICNRLKESGIRAMAVSIGNEFEFTGDDSCSINPGNQSHYGQLMQALQLKSYYPDTILHCWTYAETGGVDQLKDFGQAHQRGVISLLGVLQSLAQINSSATQTRLLVISSDVQQCMREKNTVNPHAAIVGLLKTAPFELEWLSSGHVDFPLYETENELVGQVDSVFDEIADASGDDEIAYLHGQRCSWHLVTKGFAADQLADCPIEPGGLILITGGLGGVGGILARFLLKEFGARLILVGRTSLPAREEWPGVLQQQGKLSDRISQYLEIEALKGEFVYSVADVSDPDALQNVINSAERQWNTQLNGVFHLAVGGEIGSRPIVDETIEVFEQMFSAKVNGSLALADLVSQRNGCFMVSFGSVIGVFGEAGYASYAAAHTLLAQLTNYFNANLPGRFYQLNWSAWENIPAYAIDYFRTIGFSLITANVGMNCMLAALCSKQPNLIIGLDADKWAIRKHLEFDPHPLQELVACYTAGDNTPDLKVAPEEGHINDMFDLLSHCEFRRLEQLPETADGAIDIHALQAMFDSNGDVDGDKPETEIEKQIATYWCDVLKLNETGRHTSFFQMGGNSLNATQLISRLKQTYGISLEMRDLFEASTVSELAELIGSRFDQSKKIYELKSKDSRSDEDDIVIDSISAQKLLTNLDQLSEEQVAELLSTIQQED